jgi:hypothetical protein
MQLSVLEGERAAVFDVRPPPRQHLAAPRAKRGAHLEERGDAPRSGRARDQRVLLFHGKSGRPALGRASIVVTTPVMDSEARTQTR